MNILIVEPNAALGDIYKKALETIGHVVAHCSGAQEAVVQADKKAPDVVVLEVQLSGHSGVEFLYEFRSYAEWQHVPVILHTMVPEEQLRIPPQLNVIAHLYKPTTTLRHLRRAINELVPA